MNAPGETESSLSGARRNERWSYCRLTPGATVFWCGLSGLLVWFAHRRLWHSDLWDHINYGRQILLTGRVPSTEPLLPLCAGEPMVNVAWGAQVVLAWVLETRWLGLPALQIGYAALIVLATAAVVCCVRQQSRSWVFGMLAAVMFLVVNWQQLLVIRPQLVGVTGFCTVLAVLVTNLFRRRAVLIVLPLLFGVWANLHGSFAMGLTVMGVWAAGRFASVYSRTHAVRIAVRARDVRRLLLLILLCALATLINPNGIRVYREILTIGRHPNIATMFEWDPLSLHMKQGKAAAVATGLLLVSMLLSRRRCRPEQLLAVVLFGGLTVWSSRMINWFAPVAAVFFGIHAAAVWRSWRGQPKFNRSHRRSMAFTVVSVVAPAIALLLTPLGRQTITWQPPPVPSLLSTQTPVALGDFLSQRATPVPGLTFVPAEWAGYLMYVAGDRLQPMVNVHVHLIPVSVWSDYMRLMHGPPDWRTLLDRYNINMVIADRSRHGRLIRRLQNSTAFERQYEDPRAVLFVRSQQARR
ncbi:MAG: hypothetical protein RIK87_09000 [Fuerstiella sp.]